MAIFKKNRQHGGLRENADRKARDPDTTSCKEHSLCLVMSITRSYKAKRFLVKMKISKRYYNSSWGIPMENGFADLSKWL